MILLYFLESHKHIFGYMIFCSFIERLFRHALENSRPKSVLVNSLSVCISLLDPKRLASGTYYMYGRQSMQSSGATANPETVEGMLGSLGMDLLVVFGHYLLVDKYFCASP